MSLIRSLLVAPLASLSAAALGLVGLCAAPAASAGVQWSVGLYAPAVQIAQAPVYVQPQVVYSQPAYAPQPVYAPQAHVPQAYAPQPVYRAQPVYVQPAPVVYAPPRAMGWAPAPYYRHHHHHGHQGWERGGYDRH